MMRPTVLFAAGLIFLSAALLALALLLFQILPPRDINTTGIPGENVQPPTLTQAPTITLTSTPTRSPTPSPTSTPALVPTQTATLTLFLAANSPIFTQVGQIITYEFVITNRGNAPLGPTQFRITSSQLGAPFNCGPAQTTLQPNQTLTCAASYIINQADISAAYLVNSATASGGGQTSAPTAVTITNLTQTATLSPAFNLNSGSTIQHKVMEGEWLAQIAVCYGADLNALQRANPQITDTNMNLPPGTTVVVPGIGSAGRIYGPPCITFYTVQRGDTWSSIAQRFNADVAVLQRVNPVALSVGTEIKIPLNSAVALETEAEWPKRLAVGRSDTIRISLIRVNDNTYVPTIQITGHTASASTAVIMGTPGAVPEAAMGTEYEAFAIASLQGAAFDISPILAEPQSLDKSRIDWGWRISSDHVNSQILLATIDIQWRPKNGKGPPIQHQVWRSNLDIEVYQPFASTEQLSVFGLVSGSLGSGLSFPFLQRKIKERKNKTQQKRTKRKPTKIQAVVTDEISFRAIYPKEGKVETWHTLLVYAHLMSAMEDVRKDIQRFKSEIPIPKEVVSFASARITRGTEITVIPSCEGIVFNPERVVFKWMENYHRADFRFWVDKSLSGDAARGQISIYVGPLMVGTLKFAMVINEIDPQMAPEHEVHARMYRQEDIFVSYSHKDTAVVLACKKAYEALGFNVLIDIETLRAGQVWNEELMSLIDHATIFQLFWSQNSSESKYCRQEWKYALKQNKDAFIRPVYWETPMPKPPKELSKYHFEYMPP